MNVKPNDDDNTMKELEKMIDDYIKHRKSIEKVMNKMRATDDKMEIEDLHAEFKYHSGYCKAAEQWMRAFKLNPDNDYIVKRLGIETEQ